MYYLKEVETIIKQRAVAVTVSISKI